MKQLLENKKIPDGTSNVDFKETHISWVVLGDDRAFKIKKPVKFSFADFSTPEKRKEFCDLEIELNSRISPKMYLGVVPVIENKGNIQVVEEKNENNVIDHAVMMKRMDNNKQMDVMLDEDRVDKDDVRRVAEKVVHFHKNARMVRNTFDVISFQDNYADINKHSDYISSKLGIDYAGVVNKAVSKSKIFLNDHRNLLNDRTILGFVKEVHGDLHSGNIFLYQDPVIFDCIEFNKSLRQIDILNEIAFFTMDMDFYGREDLAEEFFNLYAFRYPLDLNNEIMRLYNYYKSYRANVKAKILILAMQQSEDGQEQKEIANRAMSYIDLLDKYINEF